MSHCPVLLIWLCWGLFSSPLHLCPIGIHPDHVQKLRSELSQCRTFVGIHPDHIHSLRSDPSQCWTFNRIHSDHIYGPCSDPSQYWAFTQNIHLSLAWEDLCYRDCAFTGALQSPSINKRWRGSYGVYPPVTISLSDRPGHFFQSGFWPGPPVTIPWSHRPGFFHFFLKHIFDPKCQWPYYGLIDWD